MQSELVEERFRMAACYQQPMPVAAAKSSSFVLGCMRYKTGCDKRELNLIPLICAASQIEVCGLEKISIFYLYPL